MTREELWQSLLSRLQLQVSLFQFNTWLKNVEISSFDQKTVRLTVNNTFTKEWLEKKYKNLILKNLKEILPQIQEVSFEIKKKENITSLSFQKPQRDRQFNLEVFQKKQKANLNLKYRFSNFVVGSFNELAHAAGLAVVKNPGKIYNPLFIYGSVGLGKTHLLQAIGNEILETQSELEVKYIQAQVFVSQVIQAIKNKNIDELKKKWHQTNVLIVDDIQFLAGKERTQEEFFYLFNFLYENQRQIIISSDRSPREIPALAERLRSRFEGGLMADISFPDYESRMAILKSKCQEKNIELSEEILEYIAQNIKKNIRELEGALNFLIFNINFKKEKINFNKLKDIFKKIIEKPKKVINSKIIIKEIADFYGLKEKDLFSKCRRQDLLKPRHIAMFFLREELKNSYTAIAKIFGGKDHTTVMHACHKIIKEMEENENLKNEINTLKERIFCG
ncbi:MAG: chromosomal replication initiator protein DnaA [Minisyncoccales bacterium]